MCADNLVSAGHQAIGMRAHLLGPGTGQPQRHVTRANDRPRRPPLQLRLWLPLHSVLSRHQPAAACLCADRACCATLAARTHTDTIQRGANKKATNIKGEATRGGSSSTCRQGVSVRLQPTFIEGHQRYTHNTCKLVRPLPLSVPPPAFPTARFTLRLPPSPPATRSRAAATLTAPAALTVAAAADGSVSRRLATHLKAEPQTT